TLRCPGCKTTFPAREIDPDPAPPAPKVFGAPFVLAVTVAVLLGGSLIAAAVLLGRPGRPDPVASEAERLDDERWGPEAGRAEVERREQKLGPPGGEAPVAAAGKVAGDEGEGPAEGKGAPEARQAEERRLADFRRHLEAGKAALAAASFADAVREFA